MHTIYDYINSFCSLLDTEYHLVLGRKGVAVELCFRFGKKDCFHFFVQNYAQMEVDHETILYSGIRDGRASCGAEA